LVAELRKLRDEAADDDRVFRFCSRYMNVFRKHLAAARIQFEDAQGRRVDLHALRHTCGTNLQRAKTDPRRR
jgi:hypothetical protein